MKPHGLRVLVALASASMLACGGSASPPAPPVEARAAAVEPVAPAPPPEPATPPAEDAVEDIELALLEGFTKAVEARDIDQVAAWLAPELAAELRRLHAQDPTEFWARGSLWTSRAAAGLELVARQGSDGVERWRGLVRFGDGFEESVVFGRFDGRVLLADL